jgi:hypothetical protein
MFLVLFSFRYDFGMGGCDRVDQLMAARTVRLKSNRWPMTIRKYFLCDKQCYKAGAITDAAPALKIITAHKTDVQK